MYKILVVDDHAVVREGIKSILAKQAGFRVTGEASSGQEALKEAIHGDYDIVILDIRMPDRSGFDVLADLLKRKPALRVLVLSMVEEEQYAIRVLEMGGAGYLTKRTLPQDLVAALHKVGAGGNYLSPEIAELLTHNVKHNQVVNPIEKLSNREFQIMCMIGSGKSISDIASELVLSVQTISTFRRHILDKMGLKNNLEIMRYVLENHLEM
ncbi:MAG: response regulator transcription factor [Dehalococcoidales bacterium]|jgi:DNA-binding NarL/FixJ family response regulator